MKKITIKSDENNYDLSDFLTDCEIRGLQAISIESYEEKLSRFLKNYTMDQNGVNQYILDSKAKNIKIPTINSNLRAIKVFTKFYNLPIKVDFLKEGEIIKETYTDDEIAKLIKKPNTKSFTELKTWALINFLVGTGCRISTALETRIEDIDFTSGLIFFRHNKNHKQQYFPISKGLFLVLKQYLKVRGNEGYLFCNQYGNKADKRSIQQQVADYNRSRGISKTSCHLFRNYFAYTYLKNGGDIYHLSRLLNHSSLEMSAHYAKVVQMSDLKQNFENLSPLDINIKNKIRLWKR